MRWSLGQALVQEGYEVVMAENGKKAIEAAKAQPFDCIITDLVMPDVDGWNVLETLRQAQSPPRVIMITAYGREDTEKRAQEQGVWAYVEKPYLIDKIKALLQEMLSGKVNPKYYK